MKRRRTPQPIKNGEIGEIPPSVTFWLDHLRIERGLAENTLSAYRRDLVDLARHCKAGDLSFPEKVTRKDLQDYLKTLSEQGISAHSRQRKLVALRGFFKFL
ncbi:MAG: site-specific integrase, partial [Planctomycetota bacterium]